MLASYSRDALEFLAAGTGVSSGVFWGPLGLTDARGV